MKNEFAGLRRPMPPDSWQGTIGNAYRFTPAPEIYDWLNQTILKKGTKLYNPHHEHLEEHDGVCFLWAEDSFLKQGRIILGQCELVSFRVSGWQKFRQEAQMIEWFGFVPKALITLSAEYCRACTDDEFCALVEHELCHLEHKETHMGPCFDQEGRPALKMRGHDVEEFYTVVERYGAGRDVQHMVDLANKGPTLGRASLAQACGTCILRLA
jgi:hypothetical protein